MGAFVWSRPGVESSVFLFQFQPVPSASYPRERFPLGCLCTWQSDCAGIPRLQNRGCQNADGWPARGPGPWAAGGTRHLALRPAMAWHAACLFSAAACSLVGGIREVTGGGAGLRAALRPEGHGDGEPAPPPPRGRGLPGPLWAGCAFGGCLGLISGICSLFSLRESQQQFSGQIILKTRITSDNL